MTFAARTPMFPGTRSKRMRVRFETANGARGFFGSRLLAQADLSGTVVDVFLVRGSDDEIEATIARCGGRR